MERRMPDEGAASAVDPAKIRSAVRGLTQGAAVQSRAAHGQNVFSGVRPSSLLATLRGVVTEPMFLLLLVACAVYLGLGQRQEAVTLGVALLLVSGISVYQSLRSDRALGALRDLTQPKAQLWRGGVLVSLPTEEIVVGDAVLIEEGGRLPADGTVQEPNDFTADESVLTGESAAVSKAEGEPLFAGTTAPTGRVWMSVTAVGTQTELGRIGRGLESLQTEKTLLQRQVNTFVIRMAWIGVLAFALVWGVNSARSGDWVTALLFGLTLAMSVLPEEIPVAFSSFMALGAARLSRLGVLTKQPQTVESLGSATVICADKTGTLTQEGMTLRQVYDGQTNKALPFPGPLSARRVGARVSTVSARKSGHSRWPGDRSLNEASQQSTEFLHFLSPPSPCTLTTPQPDWLSAGSGSPHPGDLT
jgi:Ca2+-transporting ATPase